MGLGGGGVRQSGVCSIGKILCNASAGWLRVLLRRGAAGGVCPECRAGAAVPGGVPGAWWGGVHAHWAASVARQGPHVRMAEPLCLAGLLPASATAAALPLCRPLVHGMLSSCPPWPTAIPLPPMPGCLGTHCSAYRLRAPSPTHPPPLPAPAGHAWAAACSQTSGEPAIWKDMTICQPRSR